jgi:hypothetical protein
VSHVSTLGANIYHAANFNPMRKIIVLIYVLIQVSFFAFSQEINLTWGPEKKSEKSNAELGYVGRVADHFYTLRKQDRTMYLAKTRIKDMALVWDREIKWNEGRKNKGDDNLTFNSFRLFKTHFVFYFEDYSSKDDLQRLYAQKINFDGAPFDPLTEIGVRKKERRSKDGSYGMSFSADSTHFLLTTNPSFEKYNDERFYFKILNSRLETLHSLEMTLPFRDKDFEVETIRLSKNNLIHVLAKITLPKKDRKDDEATYYYEIITFDPKDKGKGKEFEVKLDNRYVDKVDLILDDKDNLKCFGFYADMENNGKRKSGINGIFYFSVVGGKASNISLKPFDLKMVFEIEAQKRKCCFINLPGRAPKVEKGITAFFNLKDFFNKPDGGMIVLAEKSYVNVVTTTSSNGSTSTTYYYVTNDVLAVNIDPKGNIVWYAHVPKKQVVANDNRFGSFHAMYVKGKIHMVYNDHAENATSKTYKQTMQNYMKAVPVVVTINADGKADKKIIGDAKGKNDFTLKPNISDKISDSEAFFYADRLSKSFCVIGKRRSKTQRFGILSIK